MLTIVNNSLKLQREMDNFLLWASVNGLSVNSVKCFVMPFARGSVQLGTSYKINDTDLEGVDTMRNLGVVVDSKMSFVNHIESNRLVINL